MPIATIACHNFYDELNRDNRLFEQSDASIGDDLLVPFHELRRIAAEQGITVATTAVLQAEVIDAYLFIDMPATNNPVFCRAKSSKRPLYLIVAESRLVRPQNYDPANLRHFRKIFTYDDSLVDGQKFIKLNYAFRLPETIPFDVAAKDKLCVMIAGNKFSGHAQELYGERLAAIRWFEENHPADFDLYGVGWEEGIIGRRLPPRLTRRWRWLGRLGAQDRPSYRGRVERKRDVMGRYRFALCYENIKDVPGYITEKLFDAFFSGTVPVYRGADNVTDHIPAGCFVDLRHFADYEKLYAFLKSMQDEEYRTYLDNIERFLYSEKAYPFTSDCFAKTIIKELLDE
jgi:hypothetical protein